MICSGLFLVKFTLADCIRLVRCRPQVVMATGQVLLHRFYCKQSFARFSVKVSVLAFNVAQARAHDILCHAWFVRKPFPVFHLQRVAASCVWLAAKLEETPRKIRDVLFVFHRLNQRREGLPLEPLEQFSKASPLLSSCPESDSFTVF